VLDVDEAIALLSARPALTAIMVDFDGSISPIVSHPEDARPLPHAVDVLARLVGRYGRVAIVSGRPVQFLQEQVDLPGLSYAGLYGLEYIVNDVRHVDPRVEPFLAEIAAASSEAQARLPGVYVERKAGICVTLHWRMDIDRRDEVLAVATELAEKYGLDAPQRGRKAVELRPPIPVDKATAVDTLLDGMIVGAFAGDDRGDLPAFRALSDAVSAERLGAAVRIGVLSPEAPSELRHMVDLTVDGPDGLADLLGRL
jgi:trehalose 6-phosphate phosphatase